MNDKNFFIQSESIRLYKAGAFKAADNINWMHA